MTQSRGWHAESAIEMSVLVTAAAIIITNTTIQLPRFTKLLKASATFRQSLLNNQCRFFKEGRHGILEEQTPTHKEQGAPASDMFLGRDHLAIWELRSLHLRLEKVPRTFLESQSRERHLIAFSNEKHMSRAHNTSSTHVWMETMLSTFCPKNLLMLLRQGFTF